MIWNFVSKKVKFSNISKDAFMTFFKGGMVGQTKGDSQGTGVTPKN